METNINFPPYRAEFFVWREMFQTRFAEKIKTHILSSMTFFFSKILSFMRKLGKILYSGSGNRRQNGGCALHAGYLRLQIHTHTHSGCVIISAFPLQQWLHERSSMLDWVWNVMAHAQKPDFVFRRKERVNLNRSGTSVQSITGSRGVRISGSNAGYTMFRGSVKGTGYPLHSPVSPFTSPPVRHRVPSRFSWTLRYNDRTSSKSLSLVNNNWQSSSESNQSGAVSSILFRSGNSVNILSLTLYCFS